MRATSTTASVRLSANTYSRLELLAMTLGIPVSDLLRSAIEEFLERETAGTRVDTLLAARQAELQQAAAAIRGN